MEKQGNKDWKNQEDWKSQDWKKGEELKRSDKKITDDSNWGCSQQTMNDKETNIEGCVEQKVEQSGTTIHPIDRTSNI